MQFPRRYWVFSRSSDWWANFVLGVWSDKQWLKHFRMTRSTFMGIVSVLQPRLEQQKMKMHSPIPTDKRVAAAIWYLANTDSYREVGEQFGIGLPTVGETVLEVCFCIELELYASVVCLGNEIGKIMDDFRHLGMPHFIGAIDGTHIAIRAPGGRINEHGNRKHYCSVLLQGTVDHLGLFLMQWWDTAADVMMHMCSPTVISALPWMQDSLSLANLQSLLQSLQSFLVMGYTQ